MKHSGECLADIDSWQFCRKRLLRTVKSLVILARAFYVADDKAEFNRHHSIRNRITDHFDHKRDKAILSKSISLTAQQTKPDESGIKRGWLFYGIRDQNREISRFFIADDVLNTAWREGILKIPFHEDGYADSEAVKKTREVTWVRANFSGAIFV